MTEVLDQVETRHGTECTDEDLAEASDGFSRPVLFRGLCSDTVAAREWTLERLLRLDPEHAVPIEHYPTGDTRTAPEMRTITLGDYAAALERGESAKWYLAANELRTVFPAIADQLPRLPIVPRDAEVVLRSVFFGVDTASATHFHTRDHAVLVQIQGTKQMILAPPDAADVLRTNPPLGGRPQFSTCGPEPGESAVEYFRTLLGDRAIVVDLEPGDALFIPVHWWHWTEGPGTNLSVTPFWRAPLRHWHFPQPGIQAAMAVGLGPVVRLGSRSWKKLRALVDRS